MIFFLPKQSCKWGKRLLYVLWHWCLLVGTALFQGLRLEAETTPPLLTASLAPHFVLTLQEILKLNRRFMAFADNLQKFRALFIPLLPKLH